MVSQRLLNCVVAVMRVALLPCQLLPCLKSASGRWLRDATTILPSPLALTSFSRLSALTLKRQGPTSLTRFPYNNIGSKSLVAIGYCRLQGDAAVPCYESSPGGGALGSLGRRDPRTALRA